MKMGTINGSCDNSAYGLKCDWSSTQNVNANTSSITAIVYIKSNGSYSTQSSNWSCVINGSTVTSGKSLTVSGSGWYELGRKSWTVSHGSNGTCSTTISFSYSNGLSSASSYTTKSGSGSGTATLPTIPRGSTIALNRSSATIGSDQITVSISRASSSFTHKVQLYFGSYSALLAEGVGTSYSFTPAISLCNQIPNATSGTATIKVQTMNGSTWVAETSKTITFNVPSSVVPSVGISITPNNALSGHDVAGKTTFTVKATNASGSYSSTIKSYLISGGGLNSSSSSATSGTLSSGSYTFTVKVTDSRGRTASASASRTIHPYSQPSFSANVYRSNSDGSKNDSGTYVYGTINNTITNIANANVNAKQYRVEWKKSSDSSYSLLTDWTNLSVYSGSQTISLGDGWATTTSYNVKILIKDSYTTVSNVYNVGTIGCLMDFEKNGVGVGKIHEKGVLDVSGDIYMGGKLVSTDHVSSLGVQSAETGRSVLRSGIYTFNTNNASLGNSTPSGYWSTISFGRGASGSAQIAVNWTDSGNELWFRSLRDTTDNWWSWKKVYHTGSKPSPQDIGAMKTVSANGYYGMTANGDTTNWVRTTVNGIIPYQSGTNSSLGTSSWIFAKAYVDCTYTNEIKSTSSSKSLGLQGYSNVWITTGSDGGSGSIFIQSPTIKPHAGNTVNLGDNTYKWKAVYSNTGTIQTSDMRYKSDIKELNNKMFFDMVKGTGVHSYVLNNERVDLKDSNVMPLTMEEAPQEQIHVGILAQELAKFDGSEYILNYDDEVGYTVNNYNLTSAIMSALKQEITYREQLEEKVKTLEERLVKLEVLLGDN